MTKIILLIKVFTCLQFSIFSIQAQTLYGTTIKGGNDGGGTINKYIPATNSLIVAKSFESVASSAPYANFIQAGDGKLYGMTHGGGSSGFGAIFSFDPSPSNYEKLKDFDYTNGASPYGSLILASDGKLYGMTSSGGSGNFGVIFSYDPFSSTFTKLKDFNEGDGGPQGSLLQANDGKLYGMTLNVIFSFDPSTFTYTKLKDFDYTSGSYAIGSFMQASNGRLYGMTSRGGNSGVGVIFSYDPSSSTFTKLKDFEGINGASPSGSLMQASNGKLYGMTSQGGSSNNGVIFSFDPFSSTYIKLNDFGKTNGARPGGSFMQASDGKLYGMTFQGGSSNDGVIFSYDPSSSIYTKLNDFDSTNGAHPNGSLMQASDGKLYGMTTGGGGVIFSFDLSTFTYTKFKDFGYSESGSHVSASLMQASDGKLYGTTASGGSNNYGVIFSFDPASFTFKKLKDFDNTNGYYSFGSLMQASDGKLYGMTHHGGSSDYGVIFSFNPTSSTYTKLKDFNYTDGAYPFGSLMQASDKKLYGMTAGGGSRGGGVIFSFNPSTFTYTKLRDFDFTSGGSAMGSLMQASDGKLYGMTQYGGSNGVIFSFDPLSSTYAMVKDFDYINGASPTGSLMQASDGKLYGMTSGGGGLTSYGVIFSFDPSSSIFTKLKDFDGINGESPSGSLMQASDGKLYGMTESGGSSGVGVMFSYDPSSSTYTKLKDYNVANGANPHSAFIEVIDESLTLSCPSSKTVPADKGRCDAIVKDIDPLLQDGSAQINYTLSGATVASGTGSVSGQRFNKGVTTVTYSLADDASKKCLFTVTVEDKEPPSITNIAADPASLWPPNHKMNNVTISYDVKDNCGFNSPTLSVSGNGANNGNSTDWIIADSQHVQLRAEKGKRGTERIYTITISATDLSGNKSIKTINIGVSKNKIETKVSAANRSALIEQEYVQTLVIKVTPNPSLNYFTLFTKSNSDKPINVRVTDLVGRVVETRLNIAANGKLRLGSNYRQGIYFVEVVQGMQRQSVKLVKQ